MAVRLSETEWKQVWKNVEEIVQEDENKGFSPSENEVSVVWLDPGDASAGEWAIVSGDELLEDGFTSEAEAEKRFQTVEKYM